VNQISTAKEREMNLRRVSAIVMALFLVAHVLFPTSAFAATKRRIAILPFEYGAVSSTVGTVDVGKGITSLLITKLVNDGTYSVVERQVLDSILKEQNLSVSDRADPSTACKIGKLLSVDAIIVGTVTQFGFESKTTNVGAGVSSAASYVPYGGFLGGFGSLKHSSSKVRVSVDARLVDINTSEILAATHGSGESKRSGTSLWGGGYGSGGGFDMGSSDFASSIAGEATIQAVDQMGGQLVECAAKIPDNQSLAALNVEGKIADVTGTTVIVNVGTQNGIKNGDNLKVDRAYKTVKDPVSGKTLKELTNTIAIINITQADKDSSTGSIVKGAGVRVGDNIKKVTTEVSSVVITPVGGSLSSAATRTMNATGTLLDKAKHVEDASSSLIEKGKTK
jgi:curli biogenesis system outer membrane secretion channel CsgG